MAKMLMVIDSSTILSILQNELERHAFHKVIFAASQRSLFADSLVGLSIFIISQYGCDGQVQADLDLFLNPVEIQIVKLDSGQVEIARLASAQYGVENGRHRAVVDFGNSFSYVLVKWSVHPRLFNGDYFSHAQPVSAAASSTQL